MSEPLSTGFFVGKSNVIFYALGGSLLSFSFYEPLPNDQRPLWIQALQGLGNLIISAVIGVVLGSAINDYFKFDGMVANTIYGVFSLFGLVTVGALYRVIANIKRHPENIFKLRK